MADLFSTLHRMGIEPQDGLTAAEIYTEHRVIEAGPAVPEPTIAPSEANKSGPGIQIGDRVIVRYLDDNKQLSFILTNNKNDPTNGTLSISSPLGSKLVGLNEEDEVEFETNGRVRRVMVVKAETGEAAAAA
jgi:transcription elongation GreA/GreB family factor